MRKILIGLGIAVALVAAVVFLRSAGHKAATQGLDQALANLPPGMTATHGTVKYDPILGTFSVADLTLDQNGVPLFTAARLDASGIERQGKDGQPSRIGHLTIEDATLPPGRHAARIELTGVALAELRDVLDPANYPNGKPAWTDRRMLIDRADITDASAEFPGPPGAGGVARIKHSVMDHIAARPFDLPPTADNRHDPAFWSAVARVLALKSATSEKLDVSLGGAVHYTIASEDLRDLDAARIGSLQAQDIRVQRPTAAGELKLNDMSLQGLDATAALPLLPQALADPKHAAQTLLGKFRIAKLHAGAADMVVAKGPHVQLASFDAVQAGATGATHNGTVSMKSLSLAFDPASMPPGQAQALQRFGMTTFTFDLNAANTYDSATRRTVLQQFDVIAQGLGTLHVTGTLIAPPGDGSPGPAAVAAAQTLRGTVLENAILRWNDASLTNRALTLAADSRGTTLDAMRAQLAMATLALGMIMPDQPDAAGQVNAFLAHPKTLTITLSPPKPVTFGDVEAAPVPQRAGLLGAHIQAE